MGEAQPIVGGVTSRMVVLGMLRKQAEGPMESKPVSSTPEWPLHQLLPPGQIREDLLELEAILVYIPSSRIDRTILERPCFQTNKQTTCKYKTTFDP